MSVELSQPRNSLHLLLKAPDNAILCIVTLNEVLNTGRTNCHCTRSMVDVSGEAMSGFLGELPRGRKGDSESKTWRM